MDAEREDHYNKNLLECGNQENNESGHISLQKRCEGSGIIINLNINIPGQK